MIAHGPEPLRESDGTINSKPLYDLVINQNHPDIPDDMMEKIYAGLMDSVRSLATTRDIEILPKGTSIILSGTPDPNDPTIMLSSDTYYQKYLLTEAQTGKTKEV